MRLKDAGKELLGIATKIGKEPAIVQVVNKSLMILTRYLTLYD